MCITSRARCMQQTTPIKVAAVSIAWQNGGRLLVGLGLDCISTWHRRARQAAAVSCASGQGLSPVRAASKVEEILPSHPEPSAFGTPGPLTICSSTILQVCLLSSIAYRASANECAQGWYFESVAMKPGKTAQQSGFAMHLTNQLTKITTCCLRDVLSKACAPAASCTVFSTFDSSLLV